MYSYKSHEEWGRLQEWGRLHFNKYHHYAELQDIIDGKDPGREIETERILSYNYGLALHDIFYASKIFELLKDDCFDVPIVKETAKFWV